MKTIRQWLNELPEPYKSEALENMKEKRGRKKSESAKFALCDAFLWGKTKQGYDYWRNLKDSL